VEQAVRSALLARLQAYQAKGLAGIAPYALSGGKERSPADELRSASTAARNLQKYVPAAYQMLLDYPSSKAPGTEDTFRWTRYLAHGVPTVSLTHSLYVPDGDAWVAVQRQYYVSTGYNSEQALGAFLPVKGGTVVVYTNRTSTEQVTGFGGSAKRSIGSKLLASQLEDLYQKAAASLKKGGGKAGAPCVLNPRGRRRGRRARPRAPGTLDWPGCRAWSRRRSPRSRRQASRSGPPWRG